MAKLLEFVQQYRKPFVWGVSDCGLMPADWVLYTTGRDIAASLRGQYSNENECIEMIERKYGSMIDMYSKLASDAGINETEIPKTGDVVLCKILGNCVGGVWFDGDVLVKTVTGLCAAKLPISQAWAIPCRL